MMEERNYYAVDRVFSFGAALTNGGLGLAESCDFTRMKVLFTEVVNKALTGQRGGGWVERELVRLRSNIWKLKSVVAKTFAPHCSPSLFTLRLLLLKHPEGNKESFGNLLLMDAGPIDHLNLLIENSHSVTSWRH